MLFCFVSVRGHNHFMTELLAMVAAAVADGGHEVEFAFDEFPTLQQPGAYIVIPHEFYGHPRPAVMPTAAQRAHTIALCTENPGTSWFEHASTLLPLFGGVVAINRSSTIELKRRLISCEHFQLGYSTLWDQWQRDEQAERPIDILYLGAQDLRRDPILATYGRPLWSRNCQFLVPRLKSRSTPAPDYLTGVEKHRRLRESKLLLNLHRAGSDSLEWPRFLEAACNGSVVLSEPCCDQHPLVAGEHFITGSATSLPMLADRLLDDPEQLGCIRRQAYEFVRQELPMGPSVERLAALAEQVLQLPSTGSSVQSGSHAPEPVAALPAPESDDAPTEPSAAAETRGAQERLSAAVRRVDLEVKQLRREVADVAYRLRTGESPELEVHASTPAYLDATPRVTVAVTVHNYEREVVEALSSVAATPPDTAFEVLVLDDASTDASVAAVTDFFSAHPWLPARLLCQPVNRGLGHARTALLEHARGEYVFTLDADNGVYPSALARLTAALDSDSEASFAYPMIAMFRDGSPGLLMNGLPWKPALLRHGNYIDAMALVRRQHMLELGGYTSDPRLTGWEDFHLWCKCAEAGRHGILVPQVLAWYRQSEHSMIADVETSTVRAWSVMRARFRDLLAPDTTEAAGLPV